MRKKYIRVASIFLTVLVVGGFFFVYHKISADADTATSTGSSSVTNSTDAGRWKEDATVTAVGKAGARAREVLNWALSIKDAGFSSSSTALQTTWSRVRDIMGIFYFMIIVVIGFGLIAKQEWAERTRRSLPALIIAFAAAYFSYFVEVGTIRFTDEQIQNRLYTIHKWDESDTLDEKHLRAQDLLTVSFSYQEFKGYRKIGDAYDESIANHLLLVKIATFTNYLIAFIILLRIVILWGLVIFSPFMFPFFVFPLTKKVATVWLRQFFYWLFLGPLFALFLTSVPYIWSKTNVSVKDVYTGQKAQTSGIPLEVNKSILNSENSTEKTTSNVYESGTNIILSPPGNTNADLQKDSVITSGNNLSETDTYSRWIVALLMIWGAIMLPFMLLRIAMGFSVEIGKSVSNVFGNSQAAQYIYKLGKNMAPPPQPVSPGPGGITRERLVEKIPTIAPTKQIFDRSERVSAFNEKTVEKLSVPAILNVAGMKQATPELYSLATAADGSDTRKISDLAKIEQQSGRSEVLTKTIESIGEPANIGDAQEQDKFNKVREAILMKSVSGDKSAQAMKNAISNNASQYLVSDIKSEIQAPTVQRLSVAISKFTNQAINQPEVAQFQNIYGVSDAKSFETILNNLAQNNDPRASRAISAFSKIKSATGLTDSEKINNIQKIGLSIANPQLIADPTEKQEYTALRDILRQGASGGITSIKDLLGNADSLASASSGNIQLLGGKFHDLSSALLNLSASIENNPKYQDKVQSLKEFAAEIDAAVSSSDEKQMSKTASAISGIKNPGAEKDPVSKQKYESTAGLLNETAQDGIQGAGTIESILDEICADIEIDQNGTATISTISALRSLSEKDEDFLRTKQTWMTHYQNAPTEAGKERKQWLTEEINTLQNNLNNLLSNDPTKKEAALQGIKKILPLALMGNYKSSDIAKYMLAKLDAAKETFEKISNIQSSEQKPEEFVNVNNKSGQDQNKQTMATEENNV